MNLIYTTSQQCPFGGNKSKGFCYLGLFLIGCPSISLNCSAELFNPNKPWFTTVYMTSSFTVSRYFLLTWVSINFYRWVCTSLILHNKSKISERRNNPCFLPIWCNHTICTCKNKCFIYYSSKYTCSAF